MNSAKPAPTSAAIQRPRVLVVDDEPVLLDLLSDMIGRMDCDVVSAGSVAQAKRKLVADRFELLVTDVNLPDGDGLSLLATMRRHQPVATAIVITGAPSVDGAVTALRGGAVDFVSKPFTHEQLVDRVRTALVHQVALSRQEKRLTRLRLAVKKLGVARRTVSKKVDLLCNDLINAYSELSKQVDIVRTQENFRKHIEQSRDLEQLLCHTMDWLLRQMGAANVALWLSGEDGQFQLGAYMKHSIAGDDTVADAMQNGILPAVIRDESLHILGSELKGKLKKDQLKIFARQDILGMSATYLGEALAAILFFRDNAQPFTEIDEQTLAAVSPVFATVLATLVRDPLVSEDPDAPFMDDTDEDRQNKDVGDWWKRGEAPPF